MEILNGSLRPEICKELIHFEITITPRLREFVLKHELLDKELNRSRVSRPNVRNVLGIEGDELSDNMIDEIKTLNCSKNGHGFKDRRIFCYGCGNILRPNCPDCNKSSKNLSGSSLSHSRPSKTH